MKLTGALLALGFAACSFGRADAQPAFADSLCPEASQYVIAAGKLHTSDSPQHIHEVAHPVVDAYEQCSKRMLSNGFREPQHYADVRASSFAVLDARALIAMNKLDDARQELTHWRPYAQQVVDWTTETTAMASADASGSSTTTSGDHRRSLYHDSAMQIVAAIDTELARIATLSHDAAQPQPSASPAAH
jgi:hypothetical protein